MSDRARQDDAARAWRDDLSAHQGEAAMEALRQVYGGPWLRSQPEILLARVLTDLRRAGYDVAHAADCRGVHEASIDVPVKATFMEHSI